MRARGFTLVEMLVTLAVVSLVGALLWQALATAGRLEQQLERTRTLSNDDLLRRAWVEQALAGVMTGAQGDPVRFRGRRDTLSGYTAMPPWPGSLGPELMTLEIERSGDEAQRLLARRPGRDEPLELWRWAGRDGGFEYLDTGGRWHDTWPPPQGRQPRLPVAVRLHGPPAGTVMVAVTTGQMPMLRQREVRLDDRTAP